MIYQYYTNYMIYVVYLIYYTVFFYITSRYLLYRMFIDHGCRYNRVNDFIAYFTTFIL